MLRLECERGRGLSHHADGENGEGTEHPAQGCWRRAQISRRRRPRRRSDPRPRLDRPPVPFVWSSLSPDDTQLFLEDLDLWVGWLVERYRLYTEDGGRLYQAEIHHRPWELQRGEVQIDLNTMAPVALPDVEPHVLFAPRQDTLIWPLVEL